MSGGRGPAAKPSERARGVGWRALAVLGLLALGSVIARADDRELRSRIAALTERAERAGAAALLAQAEQAQRESERLRVEDRVDASERAREIAEAALEAATRRIAAHEERAELELARTRLAAARARAEAAAGALARARAQVEQLGAPPTHEDPAPRAAEAAGEQGQP